MNKISYFLYQLLKSMYYVFYFILFYGYLWVAVPVSISNMGLVFYHQGLYSQEKEIIKNELKSLNEEEIPFWAEKTVLKTISDKPYFFVEYIKYPWFLLFVSLIVFIPLFFILTFHHFFQRIFYSIEKSTRKHFSHLFKDKERR